MKSVLSRGSLQVYRLEKHSDLNKFARIKEVIYQDKALYGDPDIEDPQAILDVMIEEGPDYWSSLFSWPASESFALYVDDKLAGIMDVTMDYGGAVLDGLHILKEYRGLKLCDPLYQACINHVIENSDLDMAKVKIKTGNNPSLGAANRNGFIETHRDDEHVTLEKDLMSLRPKPASPALELGLS